MRFFSLYVSTAIFLGGCAINLGGDFLLEGDECDTSEEPWNACLIGLSCSSVTGTCEKIGEPGTIPEGQPCQNTEECAVGLACANDFTCEVDGSPGTVADGDPCDAPEDCQAFLTCGEAGVCEGGRITFWTGIECKDPPSEGEEPIRAYFEVPGYKSDEEDPSRAAQEFYRLPFPNDIRIKDGHINLEGHPDPGVLVEELGDPVADYFDVVEKDLGAFGTQSAVFFRMNYYPLNDSMKLNKTIYLLDIDPESPNYGKTHGVGFRAASAKGRYICRNWMAVVPPTGNPLAPNTTYAAILTTGITDDASNPLTRSADFEIMMQTSEPSDPVLSAAWKAYAPLRDYVADGSVETQLAADDIAVAAVFTTLDPTRRVRDIRTSVREQPAPEASEVSVDDGDALFSLETGKVTVPFYQEGTRPFLTIADGGAIKLDAKGLPTPVETETVKYALTVPNTEMPEGGFPVFIYAHGTGGDELSFVDNDMASRLATLGAATISLEQVQHGERRGLSAEDAENPDYSPENLFYNFLHPRAARDNNVQAAADLFQTVRFIESRAEEEGLLNPDRVYFFGHSQGTQGSFLGAVFEPAVKGFVLSGAGGFLIESLLGKKKPVDASVAIRAILMDPDVDRYHPVLNIIQAAFDSVDPTNFGPWVYLNDLSALGIERRSVFMSSGEGDNYTPENTQSALAHAIWLGQSVTSGEPLENIDEVPSLPHTQSFNFTNVTAVVVRYAPADGEDGHFVIFDVPEARLQSDYFIETMLDPELQAPILESAETLAAN